MENNPPATQPRPPKGFLGSLIDALGLLLLCLFCPPILLLFMYVYVGFYVQGWFLKRRLRRKNRALSVAEAVSKMQKQEGLMIIEAPSTGWNVYRMWWSPDKAYLPFDLRIFQNEKATDVQINTESAALARNCSRYFDAATGSGCLVDYFVICGNPKEYAERKYGPANVLFLPTWRATFLQADDL